MKKAMAILCALTMLLCAAVTSSAEEEILLRFSWWGGESRHAATVEALELFMERNPNIRVEAEYGADNYNEKILTQLAGNQAPDLMQLSYTLLSEFVINGQLQPLDEHMADGTLRTDLIDQAIIEQYQIDGVTYSMPTGINTMVLLYNKDIFDAAGLAYPDEGWTFDTYMDAARQLNADTDADGERDQWGTSNLFTDKLELMFLRFLYNAGGHLWSDDGKACVVDVEMGAEILAYMKDLADEGMFPDPELTASNPTGVYDFTLQRVAMTFCDASAVASYEATCDFAFGVARAPKFEEKNAFWLQPSQLYVISKDSKYPQETAMLMDFLLNDLDAGLILGTQRGIPANSEVRAALVGDMSDIMRQTYEVVDATSALTGDVQAEIYPPGSTIFDSELHAQIDRLIYDMTTPLEAMQAIIDAANESMEDYYK